MKATPVCNGLNQLFILKLDFQKKLSNYSEKNAFFAIGQFCISRFIYLNIGF